MQLLIYNRGLEWMQGYEPSCAYLLSNGWYSKRSKIRYESNDPFNKLSKIDYSQRDYEYNIKLDDTLNFLNRVRTDNTLSYDPPSENIMRPNMKIESDPKYILRGRTFPSNMQIGNVFFDYAYFLRIFVRKGKYF